jgi:hypothetical protein
MTQLTDNIFAVEVPEGASGLDINKYGGGSELNYWIIKEGKQKLIVKDLPPGNWRILCTTRDAQDKDTICLKGESIIGLSNLPELLTSKGLDVSKNHVLLERG